ncbi:hypothetical protein ACIPYU_09510 [Paenarthrobacter nicotinovorans]|uniref:hypothetical protein n=1 Tax=Paenarthrobacter nicotinovorans TaxID=29320 RepID=UPI0037FC3F31
MLVREVLPEWKAPVLLVLHLGEDCPYVALELFGWTSSIAAISHGTNFVGIPDAIIRLQPVNLCPGPSEDCPRRIGHLCDTLYSQVNPYWHKFDESDFFASLATVHLDT